MLINPFSSKKNIPVFIGLLIFFLGMFAAVGVVSANDTGSYLKGAINVSPLYPSLIRLLRLFFGEKLHLYVLVFLQEVFAAFSIFSLTDYLSRKMKLSVIRTALCASVFVFSYLLRLVLAGKESMYCNTVLTEGITFPLYFLFVKYCYAALCEKSERLLLTAVIISFLISCTRGQLICLVFVLAAVLAYIARSGKLSMKRTAVKVCAAALCYFIGLSGFSAVWHYASNGVFSTTTMGKEALLGAVMYNSDSSDADLFGEDEEGRELFLSVISKCERHDYTYLAAPKGVLGRFQHYQDAHDRIKNFMLEKITKEHAVASSDEAHMILADFSEKYLTALMLRNLPEYLKNCLVNAVCGLVRTNSILRAEGMAWSAVIYLLCAACVYLSRRLGRFADERRFMLLILGASLANAVFCSFGVFELSRYVYYNFPCIYLALLLFALPVIKQLAKRSRTNG